jgi:hypothetical protein
LALLTKGKEKQDGISTALNDYGIFSQPFSGPKAIMPATSLNKTSLMQLSVSGWPFSS